jgi:hypothetical protein
MENAKIRGINIALALGRAYAAKKNSPKLALDADKWVTTKPETRKGRHILINGETGEIKAGLGGKFNGVPISNLRTVSRQRRDAQKAAKTATSKPEPKPQSAPQKTDPLSPDEWAKAERPLRPAPKRVASAGFGGQRQTPEDRLSQANKEASAQKARSEAKKELQALRKKVAAVRDPQWPVLESKLPDGFVQVISAKQKSLYEKNEIAAIRSSDISVQKETEKAVQVHFLTNNRFSPEKWEWLPKSQVVVKNGRVVGMQGWLAKKHGFPSKQPEK